MKELFSNLHSDRYNFNGLYQFIVDNNIPIEFVRFNVSALGMASFNKVYIKKDLLYCDVDLNLYFMVIAHEIGHYLSYKKYGLEYHLDRLSSTDWNYFYEHIIHEEIFAEKFACILYYKLNKHVYYGYRQDLHLKENRREYKKLTKKHLFKRYTNDVEDYQKAVDSLIIN